ncbi:MAG: FAD-binding oxidoreductase [Ktedonobacteraceae bacterium]
MTQNADIIIVGGGVMGASIAHSLAQQGAGRIVLLERRALSAGTTGHSGAIIRQHYSNDVTIRMAQESLRVFEHFDEIVGGNSGFTTTGLLVLSDQQGVGVLQANIELQQRLGVNTKALSLADIGEVAPGYNVQDAALACYEADAGVADPVTTTYSFGNRARDYGARIYEGVAVTQLLVEQGRMTGVATTQGNFLAPQVILAANVWSVVLARQIGITLPLQATRHPMLVVRRPPERDGHNRMHAVCFDGVQSIYLRPDGAGLTLVGSIDNVMAESDPDNYNRGVTEDEIRAFHETASWRLPVLKQAVVCGGWAGIYDDTPDYHPILGRLAAYEGLYCAVGFSGHGFKLSPTIGRWMAQLILTGEAPADMQAFAYERFEQGKELRARYTESGVLG